MKAKLLAIFLIFAINIRVCQSKRYDNYVLYRTTPNQDDHLKFLQNLENYNKDDVIFWQKPYKIYQEVEFIVKPGYVREFLDRVKHFGLHVEELSPNIQGLFDDQKSGCKKLRSNSSVTCEDYHNLASINQWLHGVVKENPKICELIHLGKSVQGRDIYALSVLRQSIKGTAILEGGMHGNEWLSTEFVMHFAKSLIDGSNSSDARLRTVSENYHWLLVPVANPDGFEYAHSTDRLWRKNRRFLGNDIFGVDLNRNFNYSFCTFGSSNVTSDDNYCGPEPFSEPESLALSKLVSAYSKSLKYYFSIHQFGQKIMIPYGDKILHVDNYVQSENFGKQAIMKIYKKFGKKYSIGNSYDVLGQKISGDSASWVKNTFNTPFVYTFLLRDSGKYGYALPSTEIAPACEEAQTGVLEIMTANIKKLRAYFFQKLGANIKACYGMVVSGVAICLAKTIVNK